MDCMVARARVLAIYSDGRVSLELVRSAACRGCRRGCLGFQAPGRTELVLTPAPHIRPGKEILLTLPASDVLRGALWLHGGPWLGLLAGACAGAMLGYGDLGCLMGAATGFGAALLIVNRLHRQWRGHVLGRLHIAPVA
jgi:positive regulator of sigma E activity